ncbi:MAG: zinc ABC transporter substrate-binding protein [Bauldia litoralis]
MRERVRGARLLVAGLMLAPLWSGASQAAAPSVFVTIKPIHSLVASVMRGVGTPYLLLKGGTSPHAYALRPSEARRLAGARLVFWVGEGLEAFLEKPLASLGRRATVIALHDADGVRLRKTRAGGIWHRHEDDHADHDKEDAEKDGHAHDHGKYDMHLWLDPRNAQAMVRTIAAALSRTDPTHAAAYSVNATATLKRIARLEADLRRDLAAVKARPYIVFHDAYQYFEERFDLAAAGSLTLNPQTAPGARRIAQIQARIKTAGVRCVFVEPQFAPRLVETVIAGTDAKKATLDPLGATLPEGPDAYFDTMRNLARSLRACLG